MGKKQSTNSAFLSFLLILMISFSARSQVITFDNSWGEAGLTVESQSASGVELNFSIREFSIDDIEINGSRMKKINLPGVFLPNDEGMPDLPGTGRYIALPQGADADLEIVSFRTEVYEDIEVSPAPRIPKETETGPLQYQKNQAVYSSDELYPREPVILSTPKKIRGVDARIIGIVPFQYNPVKKELIVYRDLKIRVNFIGGSGHFGEDRLRNRWFEPLLQNIFINYSTLPKVKFNNKSDSDTEDFEYLIITPNDPAFLAWADSIKRFRTEQGIRTGIVTTTQIGGNNYTTIKNYIKNAYNTWDIPPVAVLLLGDYGTSGNTVHTGTWNSYCVSDHLYGDVDGDDMAEIITARITAQNEQHLQIMIGKFLGYERTPPTNPNYYNHPISALGWQTERWFQICSESIAGFWETKLGKQPKRENALYNGTPPFSVWSTATNTSTVVNYFGPNGVGYIPASPSYLTDWGGNATRINNDINSGAFMLQHRDHGGETLWGEPGYNIANINALNNNDLVFVFSINCLTGKYNYSSTCFAEAFHRHPKGALGLIAASETSYSFVNDAYCWGMYDYMWPEFLPDYGSPGPERIYPAFANVYGKYFLQVSNWPYNTSSKEVTYYLFHHHGDAFSTVYSEMPQTLTVIHNPVIISGLTQFVVTADQYSTIALTLDGEILGVTEGTGAPVGIDIPFITPGNKVKLTVTKQNYSRYSVEIPVVPAEGPYVVADSCIINDATGNGNGLLDYNESPLLSLRAFNVGVAQASNVTLKISTNDPYVTITDSTHEYGTIAAGGKVLINNGFSIQVNPLIPDEHIIAFDVIATDGVNNWTSNFTIKAHSPMLVLGEITVSDPAPGGNNNQLIDPGESADIILEIKNIGSSDAESVAGILNISEPYITINAGSQVYGDIAAGGNVIKSFNVSADGSTPVGYQAEFSLNINADYGITGTGEFTLCIGQIPAIVICLEENSNSGPVIKNYLDSCGVANDYVTTMPSDLSLYKSAFVCLGIYSSNHVLSSSEGTILADFLNNGGRIYMEGGDTWYYDAATPVHSMFNIQPLADGSGNLNTIMGQAGTFAADMNFTYSGENNYIDQITNISPAELIFKNQNPAYGCAVSYDAGTYKTIGASFEFGGLTDGTYPSTKKNLMQKIIDFFNLVIPVELTTFEAKVEEQCIVIRWETATELNNMGFDIERSADNKSFTKIGSVEGKGTTTEKQEYVFKDTDVNGKGKFYYRLKQIDFDGTINYSETIEVEYSIVPQVFSLSQNYPNPFNPITTINFGIPEDVRVTLKVYDILGSEVATIVDDNLKAGYYKYEWNASNFASGIYIYRMTAGKFVSTKKLMLLK